MVLGIMLGLPIGVLVIYQYVEKAFNKSLDQERARYRKSLDGLVEAHDKFVLESDKRWESAIRLLDAYRSGRPLDPGQPPPTEKDLN
jgi:hypothetical protein